MMKNTGQKSPLDSAAHMKKIYLAFPPQALDTGGTGVTFFTTLAGAPIATLQAGTSLVTIEFEPMVHPSPIVTPGRIVTWPPIQQSSPIVTSRAYSILSRRECTSVSWVAAKMLTKGPNMTRSPIVTMPQSRMTVLKAQGEFQEREMERESFVEKSSLPVVVNTYLKFA